VVLANQRDGEQRSIPGADEGVANRYLLGEVTNVRHLDRLRHFRQPPCRALPLVNVRRHEHPHNLFFEAIGCPGLEDLSLLIVFIDHASIDTRELGRPCDDQA
jgi:hypothetical protein